MLCLVIFRNLGKVKKRKKRKKDFDAAEEESFEASFIHGCVLCVGDFLRIGHQRPVSEKETMK